MAIEKDLQSTVSTEWYADIATKRTGSERQGHGGHIDIQIDRQRVYHPEVLFV